MKVFILIIPQRGGKWMPTNDEALIRKYQLWIKEVNAEERELLERLEYLRKEKLKLINWISELKGEKAYEY